MAISTFGPIGHLASITPSVGPRAESKEVLIRQLVEIAAGRDGLTKTAHKVSASLPGC